MASRWPDFTSEAELLAYLEANGQGHIGAHYAALPTQAEKDELLHSLRQCPPLDVFNNIYEESMKCFLSGPKGVIAPPSAADIEQVSQSLWLGGDIGVDAAIPQQELSTRGLEAVWRGELALLVLAGGSGTRLGYEHPKGMFVGSRLASRASLYEIQTSRVRALEVLSAVMAGAADPKAESVGKVHLILMTSLQTDAETREYFRTNGYFGLQSAQVHFFLQSSMPCSSEDGAHILLESPTAVSMAPGGNAGVYQGLVRAKTSLSGAEPRLDVSPASLLLRDFLQRQCGVKFVQIFTVDNILAKMGDPYFTGYACKFGCDVVVKATPKVSDHERVGVFAKRDGRWGVVEYTEIGNERAELRLLPDGRLASRESLPDNAIQDSRRAFDAGNIAIFLFSVNFLLDVGERMDTYTYYHVAKKQIKSWSCASSTVEVVPGVKLEAFIFDPFEFVDPSKLSILSVDRREEFFPIKNAVGQDSPETAVTAYQGLHFNWLLSHVSPATRDSLLATTQNYLAATTGSSLPKEGKTALMTVSGIVEFAPELIYGWEVPRLLSCAHQQNNFGVSQLLDVAPESLWESIAGHVVRALNTEICTCGPPPTPSQSVVVFIDRACIKSLSSAL